MVLKDIQSITLIIFRKVLKFLRNYKFVKVLGNNKKFVKVLEKVKSFKVF